jgi:3-deoxy-D-manno-octulosonate 8-phosphate phosphatase (KDO 8-P phosphatase)
MGAWLIDPEERRRRMKQVRLLVLDCDGVLTDGSIVYDPLGREIKRFYVRDGFAIRCWQRAGHQVAVITGRFSQTLSLRCRELDIAPVIQNAPNKEPAYAQLLRSTGCRPEETCVVGDDFPDLPLILAAGIGVAVGDADPLVIERADWVTEAKGGKGAVREVIETLLEGQGRWEEVVSHYTRAIEI